MVDNRSLMHVSNNYLPVVEDMMDHSEEVK